MPFSLKSVLVGGITLISMSQPTFAQGPQRDSGQSRNQQNNQGSQQKPNQGRPQEPNQSQSQPSGQTETPKPECRPLSEEDSLKEVRFHIDSVDRFGRPSGCLFSINRWDEGRKGEWFRRSDRNFVDFEVSPDCKEFYDCTDAQYDPPSIPSDNGSTWKEMIGSSQSFSTTAGQTLKITMLSHENLITRTYGLVNLPQVTCIAKPRDGRDESREPVIFPALGRGFSDNVARDCSPVHIERHLDRKLPGMLFDYLTPQEWRPNDITSLFRNYSTDIKLNILPVDFPDAYPVSGSISHKEGTQAVISASSKYFAHSVQLVESADGKQEFNLVSKLSPIAAPNDTVVSYDAKNFILTLRDNALAELAHIDPNNKTKYEVAVYVNWNQRLDHQQFGNVLSNDNKSFVDNFNNETFIKLNLKDEFMANSDYVKTLSKGGKDWAIYVEVTATRSNKYVQSSPSVILVTEIKVDKKFNIGSVTENWTDTEKYREKKKK